MLLYIHRVAGKKKKNALKILYSFFFTTFLFSKQYLSQEKRGVRPDRAKKTTKKTRGKRGKSKLIGFAVKSPRTYYDYYCNDTRRPVFVIASVGKLLQWKPFSNVRETYNSGRRVRLGPPTINYCFQTVITFANGLREFATKIVTNCSKFR